MRPSYPSRIWVSDSCTEVSLRAGPTMFKSHSLLCFLEPAECRLSPFLKGVQEPGTESYEAATSRL